MVFWYNSDNEGSPIYSADARSRPLSQAKQWSNPKAFGDRASMTITPGKKAELFIDQLAPEDAGIYRCRLDYRNSPTVNQRVNLTVIVPPQEPTIYTSGRRPAENLPPLDEGGELHLVCESQGGWPAPRLTWYRDGRLIDETYTRDYDDVTLNRLDLRRVNRDLLYARLRCEASNTALVKPSFADIVLDVNLKPLSVNITNKEAHLSALRTYEIECVSSGSRPEAVITWWKGTHQVKHMARNFVEDKNITKSIMSYVPTIEDDGKFLTCRAENPVIYESALEDRWQLSVHYVPVVTIKLGSSLRATDINEGDDVYFECEVKANPKAYKLSWFKDGRELFHNASANVILPGGHSLVLQSVSRNSAGEYACMAVNDEGKATSRPVSLDVMYAPVCKDGSTTQVVGALKHETISLVCGVQSKPPPTSFQWTFNNSGELQNVPSTRYTQMRPQHLVTNHWHGSRLNHTPASEMDYGTIGCLATNSIGTQKVPCLFQIIVAGKPYPLQNCTALQSTGPYAYRMGHEDFKTTDARDADWLIVRCSEGFDGGLPITGYELEVYSDENVYHVNTIAINRTDKMAMDTSGNSVKPLTGPIFEIPGLEPGRNYRLHLYATNAKGRSDPVVLEPVTLKGVAMYTTVIYWTIRAYVFGPRRVVIRVYSCAGRGSSNALTADYSLMVACLAGSITAICILVVGVTLTLYRRNQQRQQTRATVQAGSNGSSGGKLRQPLHHQMQLVHYANNSQMGCSGGAAVVTTGGTVTAQPTTATIVHGRYESLEHQQQQLTTSIVAGSNAILGQLRKQPTEYEEHQQKLMLQLQQRTHSRQEYELQQQRSGESAFCSAASLLKSNIVGNGGGGGGGNDDDNDDDEDDHPDVVASNKTERRSDYLVSPAAPRVGGGGAGLLFDCLADGSRDHGDSIPASHERDSWIRQNGSAVVCQASASSAASAATTADGSSPTSSSSNSTQLRAAPHYQDVYTRSLRVQESSVYGRPMLRGLIKTNVNNFSRVVNYGKHAVHRKISTARH
ncbi:unnamed protein product [Trichogramma brassicae]|uniref:Uncharacterized protein n=1 Tax=Trichogramma brassicae TaxID=86971 RepID=A0A6H5J3F1_9HYME|nr:unnamed protein product [Trichogramma brassicae]